MVMGELRFGDKKNPELFRRTGFKNFGGSFKTFQSSHTGETT